MRPALRTFAPAAVVAALAVAAPASAAVPAGNLVVNGDAQAGAGSADSSTPAPVPVPGWTTTTAFTEHLYQVEGAFPDPAASAAIQGGTQFFAGGPGGDRDVETAAQDIALSGAAPEIDAGTVRATLSAALGGYAAQEDHAAVAATFLGAAGQTLGSVAVGPVSAADRGGVTKLVARSATATVPTGTRSVHVVITATRTEGRYNDGYADNVALVLAGATAPPAAPQTRTTRLHLSSSRRCGNGHRFTVRLQRPRGARIVRAVASGGGRRLAVVRGHSITRLTIRHAPRRRFVLRVVATRHDGARMVGRRTYRGCR